MTIDVALLSWGFWVFALTAASAYYAWSYVRVYTLRNDIYSIRDSLWEKARALNAFDDPAYRQTRRQLHSLIENSHRISYPVLLFAKHKTRGRKISCFSPVSDVPEVEQACSDALDEAALCIKRYVVRHRFFSGFLFITALRASLHIVSGIEKLFKACGRVAADVRSGLNVGNLASSFVRFTGLTLVDQVASLGLGRKLRHNVR